MPSGAWDLGQMGFAFYEWYSGEKPTAKHGSLRANSSHISLSHEKHNLQSCGE